MSKNIIVDEAGSPKALTVDALRTNKQGSGSEDWVPADGKNLVALDIGGSGTYQASDYGAYGIAVARVTPKYGGGATSKAVQQPGFGNLHVPVIQEGGLPVLLSASMVKTNLQGEGTCLWVPEDEVNLDAKYVNHSGTYRASADNCYGYSQITVSGVDVEITQDDDGDDVAEITDGGETTKEKLPSEIRVIVPPHKNLYYTGETMDYTGIVVHGFTESGIDLGEIPFDQLIFPETEAKAGPPEEIEVDGVTFAVFDCKYYKNQDYAYHCFVSANPINYYIPGGFGPDAKAWDFPKIEYSSGYIFLCIYDRCIFGAVSNNAGTGRYGSFSIDGNRPFGANPLDCGKNGVVQRATGWISDTATWYIPVSDIDPTGIVIGDVDMDVMHVPVQYNRPYDGRMLETTFDVTVMPMNPSGQGDD